MRILTTLILLFTVGQLLAQSAGVVSGFNDKQLRSEVRKGHFQWVFPPEFTKEKIDGLAKYYASSFYYSFDVKTNRMDVYPIADSEETRRIMLRFLGACQFKSVTVGDKVYPLYDFFDQFMHFNEKE
ncbi:MAG: hypothetical protein ACO28O_08760 [Crocinitomicaceae bacterium]|jgi:hypothetical protein